MRDSQRHLDVISICENLRFIVGGSPNNIFKDKKNIKLSY